MPGYSCPVKRMSFLAVLALMAAGLLVAAAPTFAEPAFPPFDGLMAFPTIKEPADPEEFSWEVTLGKGQELEQVDAQHAQVVYGDGTVSFSIDAELAHDAEGSDVPTSLTVSSGNVVTLTVHHRAGNPAAGGIPFVYPVVGGPGFERGFETARIFVPPQDVPVENGEGTSMPSGCVVPVLVGKSLKADRKQLRRAGCKLGRVRGKKSKAAEVVKQDRLPGELLVPGGRVAVTLA